MSSSGRVIALRSAESEQPFVAADAELSDAISRAQQNLLRQQHEDGHWCGHVDLGSLGVADRWADLAVATWSTQWNYGPGYEDAVLAAYGVTPDAVRTHYYRLLWDLSS